MMKRLILAASIAILLVILLAVAVSIPFGRKYDYDHIRVTKVIDGDTIILADGERVRYIGVDAPELRRKVRGRWVYEPRPFAEDSTEFNRRLTEGKIVGLESDVEKKDKYGRLLAYVYLEDGTFVNAELLKQGYAQLLTIPPNVKYVDLFVSLQREARQNNRGLWGR